MSFTPPPPFLLSLFFYFLSPPSFFFFFWLESGYLGNRWATVLHVHKWEHQVVDILYFILFLWHLQVQQLISELNEILANDVVDEGGLWKKKLSNQSLQLFEFLPEAIQEQLLLERDPHGNVQVYVLCILPYLYMILTYLELL